MKMMGEAKYLQVKTREGVRMKALELRSERISNVELVKQLPPHLIAHYSLIRFVHLLPSSSSFLFHIIFAFHSHLP